MKLKEKLKVTSKCPTCGSNGDHTFKRSEEGHLQFRCPECGMLYWTAWERVKYYAEPREEKSFNPSRRSI